MLKYLDIPCVFSSNGDGFLFHDRTATDGNIETEIGIDDFPTPEQLWEKYKKYKGIHDTPKLKRLLRKITILTEQTANQDTTNKLL
jgi:type I restriction enzyme, R subunit